MKKRKVYDRQCSRVGKAVRRGGRWRQVEEMPGLLALPGRLSEPNRAKQSRISLTSTTFFHNKVRLAISDSDVMTSEEKHTVVINLAENLLDSIGLKANG